MKFSGMTALRGQKNLVWLLEVIISGLTPFFSCETEHQSAKAFTVPVVLKESVPAFCFFMFGSLDIVGRLLEREGSCCNVYSFLFATLSVFSCPSGMKSKLLYEQATAR